METMFVRNTQPGPTVFHPSHDDEPLVWQGSGDPSGQDVLPVPASLADNYAFHRELYLGVFQIEEAEEAVAQTLEAHKATWRRRMGVRNATEASFAAGPGSLPSTIMEETGVITTGGEAKARMTPARVIIGERGGF